jgi:hypothetical protein
MDDRETLIELLQTELNRQGYDSAYEDDEIKVSKNGFHVTDILSNGSYRVYRNVVNDDERDQVRSIYESISDAYRLYEKGEPLAAQPKYHKLCEFANYVLAAKPMGYGYMEFVTWQQDEERTRVDVGHYFTDYEAAKEDLAVRAGLVNRYKMFDETELKLIRQGLVHLGADYPHLTVEQMTNVGELIEKIEMIVPAIREREIYEQYDLVAEDGLEI